MKMTRYAKKKTLMSLTARARARDLSRVSPRESVCRDLVWFFGRGDKCVRYILRASAVVLLVFFFWVDAGVDLHVESSRECGGELVMNEIK